MSADSSSVAALNRGSAPVAVVKAAEPSLDVQILQAESAVMERDRRVRDTLIAVGSTTKEEGSKWAMRLLLAGGTVAAVWLLSRHAVAPVAASMVPKLRRRGSLAVVRGAALLWPLLPRSAKSRLSSLLVSSVLKTGPRLVKSISTRVDGSRR